MSESQATVPPGAGALVPELEVSDFPAACSST